MRHFVRFVDRISQVCAVLAAVMLVSSMLIVCWMVVYRMLGNSTWWEIELATYLIVAAVLVGSPFCLKTRGHIGVDLISEWLPPRGRRVLARILAVLGFAVCLYLAWIGLELTLDTWHSQETSGSAWDPPRWPFFAMMPVGLGLTALQYVADFFRGKDATGEVEKTISGQGA